MEKVFTKKQILGNRLFEQEEDVKVAMNKLKEIFKNFWIHYEKIYI